MRPFSDYLLLAIALLFSAALSAQLVKGDRLLSNTDGFAISPLLDNQPTASNLASILTGSGFDGAVIAGAVKYGFVVSDKVVVGGGFALLSITGDEGASVYGIAPYGRYYFKNDPDLMVFGGLQVTFLGGDEFILNQSSTAIAPSAGLSLPITSGVLFSPELAYSINESANNLLLNVQLEFVLGRNTKVSEKTVGSFGKGSVMLGARAGSFALSGSNEGANILNFSPSLRYFVGDRFALGAGLGLNRQWNDVFSSTNTLLEFSGRYYLSPNKHFTPFLQGGLAFVINSFKSDFFGGESTSEFGYDLAIGGNIWLRDNLALEVGLNGRFFPDADASVIGPTLGAVFILNKEE